MAYAVRNHRPKAQSAHGRKGMSGPTVQSVSQSVCETLPACVYRGPAGRASALDVRAVVRGSTHAASAFAYLEVGTSREAPGAYPAGA